MEKKEQEVAEEYLSSLADLNLNSKPLINMLTILAEENIEYAAVIVKAVEQHIAKVSPEVKLPVLYLIDSIVKNVGRDYISLFSHCIVTVFCGVFEKVNEKIREKMYTLRQTWNDVFTPQKLYTLDVKVNCMDPNWPITAKVLPKSPAIHVNPIFLNKGEPINDMQAKLRDKQRQLLELQKRKLELELAATKQRLEEQEKQLSMQTESVKSVQNIGIVSPSSVSPKLNITGKIGLQRIAHNNNATMNANIGNSNVNKTRVAPVSSAILNSIKQRDPRLIRQQQSENSGNVTTIATTDNRGISTSLSSLPKEQKSQDSSEKFLTKYPHIKQQGSSTKEKQRTSSNSTGGNKKSHSKGMAQKIASNNESKYSSRSSSSRSKGSRMGSSKTTIINASNGSRIIERDIRTKQSVEKRKSAKSDVNRKVHEETTAKSSDKSPRKQHEKQSDDVDINPELKFKELKESTKNRNYIRRNREKSTSPNNSMQEDSDIRMLLPEKKIKMDDITKGQESSIRSESSLALAASANTSDKLVQNLDQNVEAASCMDIDLRQFQTNISQNSSLQQSNDAAAGGVVATIGPDMITTKKRLSAECNEEPASKKTRSEELDPLFGSEDVDLRRLNNLSNVTSTNNAMIMTPPPPPIISQENESWAMVKGQHGNLLSPKSNLDDVRAKLAKATKTYRKKTESRFHELQKSGFTETNEDSEDGTDAKIRTIISQAQELLDTENMNAKQYKELVKTVIQISETNKLKEAQRRESMLFKSNNLEDLTPISDDEVKFSSEDETENEIPKPMRLRRLAKAMKIDNNESDSEISNRHSPTVGTSIQYTDNNRSKGNEKRNRNREAKWASQFEAIANNTRGQKNWLHNNTRPLFTQKLGTHNPPQVPTNIPNRINVPSPWQNPPPMIFPSSIPIAHMNPVGPETIRPPVILSQQLSNSVDNPNSDVLRTVTIDKMQKEIRFYDEVPIAFMEWDQPKQIGFQNGQRRVTIDDRDSIILNFNDDYKMINIDGKTHKIRFGCPTRELFIDNDWYECYFGDPPVGIFLDGCVRIFKIEGPPPQLFIGSLRQDLVVGKINLIIDARIIIPVFLDAKTQTFEIDGIKHSLQFADYLKTVLIDNEPMSVEYGGLPKSILLNGVKHFIRFGTLPNGIIPGKVFIKDMIRTEFVENIDSPKFSPIDESCGSNHILPVQMNDIACVSNFSQLMINPIEKTKNNIPENDGQTSAVTNNVNIDELFQKLLASGILNQDAKMNKSNEDTSSKTGKEKDVVKAVDLSKPETIKIRQIGIVQKLFFGMQCSSCGVRFPPEQTMKYSQHLDWHFRQNRRERDSARKAHSRKWYYDVSDWIQYEEIEDLDEREKNWFETQQNELENFDESSNPRASSPPPSCAAGPEDVDKACDMCHDKFEQFYDEESEEWHLRSAIRIEDKIYHPVCYEDYKASLKFEESATEVTLDDNALDLIVKQEKEENNEEGIKENEDDDDVIVVPNEEPSITEIPDDDDEESNQQQKEKEEDKQPENTDTNPCNTNFKNNDSLESDVEIQEPNIPFTDLDAYEEVHGESVLTLDDSSQSSHINQVKIKEEPKYDGYDDDAFEDVGTFVYVDDISQNNDEYVTHSVTTAPHESIKPCIDGNMDLHEAGTSSVVGVNKIKINITKTVSGNNQKSTVHSSENASNVSLLVNNEESTNDTSANNIVESKSDAKMSDSVGCNKEENNTEMVENNDFSNSEIIFKPEMQGIEFEGMPVCKSGFETSGLCSIM